MSRRASADFVKSPSDDNAIMRAMSRSVRRMKSEEESVRGAGFFFVMPAIVARGFAVSSRRDRYSEHMPHRDA